MLSPSRGEESDARVLLNLLNSVERDGSQSQRRLAAELGISLGLVNAYLRRCIKKGLIKSQQVPARRYVYYLTPRGFSEKTGLVVRYLSHSFEFFRQAKEDCASLLRQAHAEGRSSIVLIGKSDLAEIAVICAMEFNIRILAVVDAASAENCRYMGVPLIAGLDDLAQEPDALLVTDLRQPRAMYDAACARYGRDRVMVPRLLYLDPGPSPEVRS
ncbi:winged helix-turn-helix transcriptional regulator [Bosea sp. TWI1241]|uniref:winged helix-turn-helix transcriptional regulator n=1 Tax=Bosea sp. TWI1241 TaxID=3148904 RepID=UPI003209D178